ncbi:MAG: PLP-dependent aminotransferase family protein [Lachnospiraceae bacterium]|nr:PLP-dependent aminotransferase family protein [Lachnospiraceae bacterium]
MQYTFSDRVQSLKPSAIREIFKYSSDPSVISLSAGNPAPEAFPVKEIAEISERILREDPISALQYGLTEGYTPLRCFLKDYMKKKHSVGTDNDDILITSGAQQIMDLVSKSILNEGDTVICENPSFIGSLNTFRSYNTRLVGVPIEPDGMDVNALEQTLKNEPKAKIIYTIPNFQNPSGITMSLEKRKAVYELARKYNVLIIEDNPYGDLRFRGEFLPCIKSFDTDGIVMYSGSFSKVISPGMRVGYVIGPAEVIQKMVVCKQGQDVHINMWSQIVCHEFVTKYDFDKHLENLQEVYRKKATFAMNLLDKHLVPNITYHKIDGGLFIWCELPHEVDMPKFCTDAVKNKVCVVPGTAFMAQETDETHSFRINFSTPTDEQLEKGITILGEMAKNL